MARGDADVADLSASGASEIARLRARYGARLHSNPGPAVVYTFLNARIPPFDDLRVRQALNYAVDRDAIVQAFGGADRASASCQILPANYPGYQRSCPYERDVAKARRLVRASGTAGTPVVVWTRASYARFFSHVDALRELGYPTRLKVVDDTAYFDELERAGGVARVQAGYLGWLAGLPTAAESPVLARLPGGHGNALRWSSVPLYNLRAVDFVSARVGNYQFNPFSNSLYDQLWVR